MAFAVGIVVPLEKRKSHSANRGPEFSNLWLIRLMHLNIIEHGFGISLQ